jgi:predicted amidophosphoribosyltransferase
VNVIPSPLSPDPECPYLCPVCGNKLANWKGTWACFCKPANPAWSHVFVRACWRHRQKGLQFQSVVVYVRKNAHMSASIMGVN